MFGYVAMTTPEPSAAVAAATAPRAPAEPQQQEKEADDGTWTSEDVRYCKSVAREAADTASARMLRAVSTNRVGLGGPSSSMIERSAFLLCSATRKRLHLCNNHWRKQFKGAIEDYAAAFRKVSSQMYWTNYNIAERAKHRSGNDRIDWETVTDDLRQTTRDLGTMHEQIVAAFRGLIADGIVDPDDFGVFLGLGIPPDIAKLIGDARPVRRLCG